MPNKRINHDKDIAEKSFIGIKKVFSAAIKAFIPDFQNLDIDDLIPDKTRLPFVGDEKLHELEKDIVKRIMKNGEAIALVSIENQSRPDYSMARRILAYAGLTAANWDEKEDGPMPTIYTLVLYFGQKPQWNHCPSLYERWGVKKQTPGMFPNIEPLIIDVGSLSREQIERLDSEDLKAVFETVQFSRKGIDLGLLPNRKLEYGTATALAMMAVTGKHPEDLDMIKESIEQKEGATTVQDVIYFTSQAERDEVARKTAKQMKENMAANNKKVYKFAASHGHPEWISEFFDWPGTAESFMAAKLKTIQ